MNKITIGIDFGKNIGLAYASDDLPIAIPYCTVRSINEAAKKIKEKNPASLIIGWPLLLDGTEGAQCAKTIQMLNELLKLVPVEYYLQDERFSSMFSSKSYSKSRRNEKDGIEHAHSAAWILQVYLDRNNFLNNGKFGVLN